jgi:hypothetical protein
MTPGEGKPISSEGSRYEIVIENGRIRRSQGWINRTLLAFAPEKGFETGDVKRWTRSQIGVVTVKEMFWKMHPTVPTLRFNQYFNLRSIESQ